MAIEKTVLKTIRVTPKEHEQIKFLADQAGVSWSRYVRQVALGERRPVSEAGGVSKEEVKEILRQLSAVGNNLNQLALVANTSGSIHTRRLDEALRSLEPVTEKILELLR